MNKTGIRMIALVIAALLVFGLFSGALATVAWGAMATSSDGKLEIDEETITITKTGISTDSTVYLQDTFYVSLEFYVEPSINVAEYKVQKRDDYTFEILDRGNYSKVDSKSTNEKYCYKIEKIKVRYAYINHNSYQLELVIPDLNPCIIDLSKSDDASFSTSSSSSTSTQSSDGIIIYTADTTVSERLTVGEETRGITVTFYYDNADLLDSYEADQFSIPANSSFGWSHSSKIRISKSGSRNRARVSGISYNGGSDRILVLKLDGESEPLEIPIPNRYFDSESSEDDKPPTADIVVESVIAKSAEGQRLVEITEDTPPFTLEIVYNDIGLMNETKNYLERAKLHAFITTAPGFKTPGGNRGRLELLQSDSEYPRFKATFTNIQNDGTANSFGFRVQYDLPNYDDSIKGESAAILYQVQKEGEGSGDLAPLKPNVIIEAYSYGEEPIVAGEGLDLNITFKNTSQSVGVENVVMTVEPANGFTIAAASNTDYFSTMSPGESIPYTVGLKANPAGNAAGTQTEYSVTVKFAYQYLSKKEYAAGETSVKIAIPVAQLDRFSTDAITDFTQMLQIGEEGYLSVPITNKGKSPTYNITGSVKLPEGVDAVVPSVHFGNLEAGKSGTVDINITINTPGQHNGEALIQYEDENMQQKELKVPFSLMVNEPMPENPEMDPSMMNPGAAGQGGMKPVSIAFCGAGGLLVAAPIALYFIKRARVKGSGDLDEDF